MIGLDLFPFPADDGISVAAYCQTSMERFYLYGLLKTVLDRQAAIKKRTETTTAYPTKEPFDFELFGPGSAMLLISYLRDHDVAFWVRSNRKIPFKHALGPVHNLQPCVLNLGSAFCFKDSDHAKLIQAEQAALDDPDNWVWLNLPEAFRKQTSPS